MVGQGNGKAGTTTPPFYPLTLIGYPMTVTEIIIRHGDACETVISGEDAAYAAQILSSAYVVASQQVTQGAPMPQQKEEAPTLADLLRSKKPTTR